MTTPPPQGQNPFAQGAPQGQNPYAAQGQPAGQTPYPQQNGPYAPVPPQQPSSKWTFKKIKNIVIPIAVVALIVGGWIASRDDAQAAAVGDCMHQGSTSSTDPDLEVVKCSSADAQYKVTGRVKGTFSGLTAQNKCSEETKDFEMVYTQSGDGEDFVLCLKEV